MDPKEFSERLGRLTPQQWEVLRRVLAGEADSEIADSLGIKLATVRKHVERIYRVFEMASEPHNRRSKRGDLFALFAQYKPELLRTGTAVTLEKVIEDFTRPTLASQPNPFVPLTGRVDDPELFFDRQREIRQIFEILNSGSSVAVIGEKEIGKSSLLSAICRQAESELIKPRDPVYLDLQLLENEDDFYTALCDKVGIDKSRGYLLTRAFQKKRLLLAIDKVERMVREEFTQGKLLSWLRGLVEGSDAPFRLVLAASKSIDLIFKDEGMTSPLEGICIEGTIERWDEATARDFIRSRLSSTSVTFTDEKMSQIIAQTGGHPQQLMELCYQMCYQTYSGHLN